VFRYKRRIKGGEHSRTCTITTVLRRCGNPMRQKSIFQFCATNRTVIVNGFSYKALEEAVLASSNIPQLLK
jgi:hypothetical protein